ncbi:MAG: pectate lyase [Verrucomicrobiota bacterium]
MKAVASFFQEELTTGGGYASRWDADRSMGHSEHKSSPTVISIQPPGTTTIGISMLRAYVVTNEEVFLEGAKGAVSALVTSQLASGGWEGDYDFDPDFVKGRHFRIDLIEGETEAGKRKSVSTLDDDKTTSALRLLLEYVHGADTNPEAEAREALEFGMEALLAAQFANGGWPQRFEGPASKDGPVVAASIPENWPREWPNEKYGGYVTLNDGNLANVMELLLRAFELTGEPRFREAAVRLGDFLLLAQLPGPQTGWAQQYDEWMHPVWARKFEPPAVSSVESYGAAETLRHIWEVTGDEKYREAALKGLAWIKGSKLEDGTWARFYELETNRPLYCAADTYELTYEDDNLPKHYGFIIDEGLGRKVERLRELFELTPEEARQKSQPPRWRESWEKRARGLRGKVKLAFETIEEEGYWIEEGMIDAKLFVKHMTAMTDYLEALQEAEKPD